jgi:hypothetical protein
MKERRHLMKLRAHGSIAGERNVVDLKTPAVP